VIEVDIVTPTRQLITGAKATIVTLPAEQGEIQVLPNHRDLLTSLGTGVLTLQGDGTERRFAISYGFAEIRHDKITVLAETAEESTEVDTERAAKARRKAEETLLGVLTHEDFVKQERKLQRAITRQQITR
jgi:F-type H+-transporting ATPase subunit epsilon